MRADGNLLVFAADDGVVGAANEEALPQAKSTPYLNVDCIFCMGVGCVPARFSDIA